MQAHLVQLFPLGMADDDRPRRAPPRAGIVCALLRALGRSAGGRWRVFCHQP